MIAGPGPAPAQEAASDLHARFGAELAQCSAGAGDVDAAVSCIGRLSAPCMDGSEGGYSTMGMVSCIQAETLAWEAQLMREFDLTRAWAVEADRSEAEVFDDLYSDRERSLVMSQLAWVTFVDAQCGLEYAIFGSGSLRHLAGSDCRNDLTARRAIDLRFMREGN